MPEILGATLRVNAPPGILGNTELPFTWEGPHRLLLERKKGLTLREVGIILLGQVIFQRSHISRGSAKPKTKAYHQGCWPCRL